MSESSKLPRRRFLANAGMALTSGVALWCHQSGYAAGSDEFVLKSQSLPMPKVVLPTDSLPAPQGPRKRVAAITTAYWKYSHADDIITKFIEGYGVVGRIHLPHCEVVSLYIEQFPKTDIGRGMAARYGIPLFKTPAEALTLGGNELAVDAVLLIGEHGDYPRNALGQKLYPRRELFEKIVKVYRRTGRSVPVFNDKHLSYSWENAEWMYRQSRELRFPMMAGSSVPVSWRRPPLEFKPGISLKTALVTGGGSFGGYGFHCLEFLQAFVEKRKGGETGVKAVQALKDEAAWKAAKAGHWPARLVPVAMAPARAAWLPGHPPGIGSTPHTQKERFELDQLRRSTVFRIEYSDGFEAAVCMNAGLVPEWCFAAEVSGQTKPVATYAYLPKPQRDHFSLLCNHIEVMFRSGKPSYPVERTLLVTGMVDALFDSRAAGGRRIETPHLANLRYAPASV